MTKTIRIPGDTSKKDHGWALLDKGSTPPMPNEDDPTIMNATAPVTGERGGTYQTPCR
jgi:hypothetical protein